MELLKSLSHPEEVTAILRWTIWGSEIRMPKCDYDSMSLTLRTCYDLLDKTIRSYGQFFIKTLDGDLRDGVCIYYLVLRALDAVEDDLTIPMDVKIPMLKSLYKCLQDPDWKYTESKHKDKIVLEQFPSISEEFRKLNKLYQEMISDVIQEMGEGMSEFVVKKVDTLADWDQYGHCVSGIVGIGLAKLFSASGLEDPIVGQNSQLARDLGLIAQKMDGIKDFTDDWPDNRVFWPKSVWSKYAEDLGDFTKVENQAKGVQCINELITITLERIPSSLRFMGMLKNRGIFTSAAIQQIIAIATLERCYNNPNVFKYKVKIRKGEVVRILLGITSIENVKAIVKHYIRRIIDKIPSHDPNSARTRDICQKVLELTDTQQEYTTSTIFPTLYVSLGLMLTSISYTYWSHINQWYEDMF